MLHRSRCRSPLTQSVASYIDKGKREHMYVHDRRLVGLKVLVTGAGGPAGYGLLSRLSQSLPNLVLHAADMSPLASGLYMVPPDRRHLLPAGAHEDFAGIISGICRLYGIDLLIPTVDFELVAIAAVRQELASLDIQVGLPSQMCLETCLDKYALTVSLKDTIPVPHTTLWDGTVGDGHRFPLVAKPRSGSGGRGVIIADGPEDLDRLPTDQSIMLCQYLPGAEYSVDVFRDANGRVLAAVPRERLRIDSGVAITARTIHDPQLEDYAAAVADRIGLRGTANVQFRRDSQGVPHLLEVNPRFPGTMALTVAAGVDIPTMAVLDAMGVPLTGERRAFKDVAIVRQWQERVLDPEQLERMGVPAPHAYRSLAKAS